MNLLHLNQNKILQNLSEKTAQTTGPFRIVWLHGRGRVLLMAEGALAPRRAQGPCEPAVFAYAGAWDPAACLSIGPGKNAIPRVQLAGDQGAPHILAPNPTSVQLAELFHFLPRPSKYKQQIRDVLGIADCETCELCHHPSCSKHS